METQDGLEAFLGVPRFAAYLDATAGDLGLAAALYRWNQQVSGALHAQIAYVEIAVRNALDRQLAAWNAQQPEMAGISDAQDWTLRAAGPLYEVLDGELRGARQRATREASRRALDHPRQGVPATHGDVVAQLMFGSWCKLLDDPQSQTGSSAQCDLWKQAIHASFPRRGKSDASRLAVAARLNRVRGLRNRVAHHDSLLNVNVSRRLNDMLAVLADLNPAYPTWAMEGSLVRKFVRQDPRRAAAK